MATATESYLSDSSAIMHPASAASRVGNLRQQVTRLIRNTLWQMVVTAVAGMARLPILRVVLQIARDVLVDALPRSSLLQGPPPPPPPRTATRDSTLLLSLVLAHTLNSDKMPSTGLSLMTSRSTSTLRPARVACSTEQLHSPPDSPPPRRRRVRWADIEGFTASYTDNSDIMTNKESVSDIMVSAPNPDLMDKTSVVRQKHSHTPPIPSLNELIARSATGGIPSVSAASSTLKGSGSTPLTSPPKKTHGRKRSITLFNVSAPNLGSDVASRSPTSSKFGAGLGGTNWMPTKASSSEPVVEAVTAMVEIAVNATRGGEDS